VHPDLIAQWKAKDPVMRYEKVLMELRVATADDIARRQRAVRPEIDAATDEAERSPLPNPADAGRGLYIEDGDWN
jgi:TPP-dependent pyruvate/acetoin dehydrogenase alpha subunit